MLDMRALAWRHAAGMLNDPLYRNSLFMAFTSVFNAGCGFFFWMIAARLYTVEQVGLATALISALGLVVLHSCNCGMSRDSCGQGQMKKSL